jgi:hypothetical protein
MKKLSINISILMFALTALISSCDINKTKLDEQIKWVNPDSLTTADVKLVHAYSSFLPTLPSTSTGPQVYAYANTAKLNGNALSYAGAWPGPITPATVPSGNVTFDFIMNRLANNIPAPAAGDTVLRYTTQLDAGKFYTLVLADTFPNPSVIKITDDMSLPAYNKYKLRVIDVVANPLDTIDIASKRQNRTIFSNLTYKNVSSFIDLPVSFDYLLDSFTITRRGPGYQNTSTTPIFVSFQPISQRIYTLVLRGKGQNISSNTRPPSIGLVTTR